MKPCLVYQKFKLHEVTTRVYVIKKGKFILRVLFMGFKTPCMIYCETEGKRIKIVSPHYIITFKISIENKTFDVINTESTI